MALTAAQLDVNVNANTGDAEHKLGGLAGMMGTGGLLPVAALAAVAAVGLVGVAAVHMAGDFQEGMTSLVTGAGESKANLAAVSAGILKMATDTGTSTAQLTAGMYMIESAGFHGKAGFDVLTASAEGAKVGGADLGVVADATTTIMKDFSASGINASQAVNTLITTVASGKTHMADLAGSLAAILPTASAAGVGLKDVMGALATMTGEGVPAADAATYLRQSILALEAPSAGTTKALKAVGVSSTEVATMMQQSMPAALKLITDAVGKKFPEGSAAYIDAMKQIAGGSKQMQGILDLTGSHMADFAANTQAVSVTMATGKNGIVGWSDVQGDFNQKISVAKEVVETLMISLGTKLLPVVGKLVDAFAKDLPPAVTFITNLLTDGGATFQKYQAIILPVAGVIGGILVAALTSMAIAAWAALAPVLVFAAPFIAVGAAVGLLAAGVIYAYQHFAPFRDTVNDVASVLQSALGAALKFIMPFVQEAIYHVQMFGDELSVRLGPAIKNVAAFIKAAIDFILPIWQAAWPAMQLVLTGVWDVIKGAIQVAWAIVSGIIKVGLDLLGGNWSLAWTDMQNMFKGIWDGIKTMLMGVLQIMVGQVLDFVSTMLGLLAKIPGPIGDMAKSALKAVQGVAAQMAQAGASAGGAFAGGLASAQSIVADSAQRLANSAVPQGSVRHFAGGTSSAPAGLALVGEQGPELVTLPGGASVLPARQTAALVAGGAGLANGANGASSNAQSTAGGGGSGGSGGGQPVVWQLDGRTFARVIMPYVVDAIRNTAGIRSM